MYFIFHFDLFIYFSFLTILTKRHRQQTTGAAIKNAKHKNSKISNDNIAIVKNFSAIVQTHLKGQRKGGKKEKFLLPVGL